MARVTNFNLFLPRALSLSLSLLCFALPFSSGGRARPPSRKFFFDLEDYGKGLVSMSNHDAEA